MTYISTKNIILMVALILLIVSPSYSEDNGSPFRTKEDLKSYMKHLHEQFGIVGRPRFGKRAFLPNYQKYEGLDSENFET